MGFELPEIIKLSKQMQDKLIGNKIMDILLSDRSESIIKQGMSNLDKRKVDILNSPIINITSKGKWIFWEFQNNNFLMFGEIIGKFSYIEKGNPLPDKYHFIFQFGDGSNMAFQSSLYAFLTVATRDEKREHRYAGIIGPSPNEIDFTLQYFNQILLKNEKKPIKAALNVQDQISGLGNAYINDILFQARIHPKRKVSDINQVDRSNLFQSIIKIITSAIQLGGSVDEIDLYGKSGGYIRVMDKSTSLCIRCGTKIVKENILGSSSYYCPKCQEL